MDVTRRKALLAAGGAVSLGGCIDYVTNGSTPDENDNNDGHDNDDPDDLGHDVFQLGPSQARPLWTTIDGITGFITRLDSENDPV